MQIHFVKTQPRSSSGFAWPPRRETTPRDGEESFGILWYRLAVIAQLLMEFESRRGKRARASMRSVCVNDPLSDSTMDRGKIRAKRHRRNSIRAGSVDETVGVKTQLTIRRCGRSKGGTSGSFVPWIPTAWKHFSSLNSVRIASR